MTRRVVLVAGPPSAGKSSHVAASASPSDLVVDLDALDGDREARARLERDVSRMHDGTAWVIRTAADPDVRAEIASRLGATETTVIATPEREALGRAEDKPDEYREAIRRWWREFIPRDGENIIGADAMSEEQQTETTEEQSAEQVEAAATEPEPESEPLGEPGKKALERERAARKEAEKKAKRAEELEAELAKFREDAMSEQEKAIEKARKEGRAEAATEANVRIAKSEAKALATGKTRDPDVAVQLLGDLAQFVTDDGDVDTGAMSVALGKLVEEKEYLAVGDRQPVPDADQGARGSNGKSQVTREQLQTMTPEQIGQAKSEGRLDKLLGR